MTGQQRQDNTLDSESLLRREGVIILLLGISVVLVIMNTAMFNLALNDLGHYFNLPPSTVALTVTGYSIAFAISSITFSRLSDFVPLRRLFAISLVTAGAASVVAMLSTQFWLLLAARVMQALGAGAAISLSIVLLTRYVPLARRGKTMSVIMSSVSLGLGLGPVVGGFVVQYMGWKYLFAITALLLCIAPILVRQIPKEKFEKRPFDVPGAITLSAGTAGLLLFLTSFNPLPLIIGIAGLAAFVLRIRKTAHPFVLPSLLADKTYLALSFVGVLSYLCSFATLFLLPQMLLKHFGLSASHAGFIIFPGAILSMLLSRVIGSFIDKYGNGGILRLAPVMILTSVVLFALLGTRFWAADILVYMLMNVGFSMIGSSVSNEISRILPKSQIGSGTGLFQLMQFFAGAFSIAVVSSALEWQHNIPLGQAFANLFWGLAGVAIIANLCAVLYSKRKNKIGLAETLANAGRSE